MLPKLRVARPTNNLTALLRFYRDALGLSVLYEFKGHDGSDGVILGHSQAPYHLEFTAQPGHFVASAPNPEHLLVFYLPDQADWQAAVTRMQSHGFTPVPAYNAYWDRQGRTFADPDGYRVVLQQADWSL
ncbi:VOC family protein [Hymenobacter sp. BT175]|uniref:VOC family protein n=1 Tax=Hymenobacter translucens TaxID=2886507 RepID=UPI001D0E9AE8|nr:VOC family protein [Hymenobacter translucens]MCC2546104.1 VOC family protein [Hymenobacter translucens]